VRDRTNLKETLNSLRGAGGMEGDKYVLLHYLVLFQSFKICWGNGGRGSDKFDRDSKFSGGSQGIEGDKYVFLHYFVLFQSSKICWKNGGRGTE
jgi:hypothetical protein